MMLKRFWMLCAVLFVLGISLPASLAQESAPLPENPLQVTEVLPVDGAIGIAPRTAITVVFNRPVVPLTILEERGDLPQPLTLNPTVNGEGEWLNTSIYVFRPTVALAGGTRYTIRVSDLESTDGVPIEPFAWSFTTEEPMVTSVEPEPMSGAHRLDVPVRVNFNQPMDEASVESAFQLLNDERGSPVDGRFSWANNSTRMTFVAEGDLQLQTRYRAALDASEVQPLIGDAALVSSDMDWTFQTLPFPAIISTDPINGAEDVSVYGTFAIEFASPMNESTIREHVRIEPEPPESGGSGYYSGYNNIYRLNYGGAANTTYTVTIEPGMEDIYGNRIEQGRTIQFTTRDFRPEYSLQIPGEVGFYNAYNDATELYLAYRNIETVDLSLYDVAEFDLVSRLTDENYDTSYGYDPADNTLIREWTINASQVERNERKFDLLNVGDTSSTTGLPSCDGALPSRIGVGDMAIVTTEPDPLRARSAAPDGEIVDLLYSGYRLPVLDGPRCIDGIPWFQVELRDGQAVWIAESVGEEYFVDVETAAERGTVPVSEGGALAPGVYLLQVASDTENATYHTAPTHFMMVSTVNVTMKYAIGGVTAWVTNVNTGEPIPGLTVQFYTDGSASVGTATTDENGVANVNAPQIDTLRGRMVAMVDTPEHFGLTSESWMRGIESYEIGVSYSYDPDDYETYLYTDRPIYRPDQPVYFRGVIREKDDVTYTRPDFEDVLVEIYDDQNNLIYDERLPLDEYGAFHDTLMLAEDAVLGSFYRIRIKQEAEGRSFETLYFAVAEFRLPEFQVDVTAQTTEVAQGEDVQTLVNAEYFFGGGVSNANVNYSVQASSYNFRYEGEGRYSFRNVEPYGSYRYDPYGRQVNTGTATTGGDGTALLEIGTNFEIEEVSGSQELTIEATVRDETGFAVSGRSNAIVHEGLLYVGVSTDSYISRVGEPNNINIITVDWDSVPVASQSVDVTVERWQWNTVQEVDDFGRVVYRSEVEQTEITTETVVTGEDGRATYDFIPEQGGVYRIATTTRDERGNEVTSARVVWASGRSYVSWRQENDRTIDLVADADEYSVGDTARILITSPFQGEATALVTVERKGVMMTDRVTLESNSLVYELPIADEYAPNIFVGVMLVKGVDENNPVASFRYGITRLNVDTNRKIVNIDIEPDVEQAQPGETVTYTVRTTDYRGEPVSAQVGLGLTDLASLSIASPNSGPMLERFYGAQFLSVLTSTPLTINTDEVTQTVTDVFKGGGGGGGGGGVIPIRSDFEDTTLWRPDLVTDESGVATVDVTLPDNLTTWRMDARAITLGADSPFLVGQETFDLVSTKPLLVRPATPRFFVVGDRAKLAAVVNNNTGADQDVTAFVEVEGVTFVEENAEQTTMIPSGSRARFEWDVTVDDVENVDVTFFATAGDFSDASKPQVGLGDDRLLPVYKFAVRETVGTANTMRDGETITEEIMLPQTLDIAGGELIVNVDTSLAATTLDGLSYLENFPHQCTEQTVSRFLPNVVTYRALVDLGLDRPGLKENLDQQVGVGLQMLYVRQNTDGGWGWFRQDESNLLTTAYVVYGMQQAIDAGYAVEQSVMSRGQQFLQQNSALTQRYQFSGGDWQYNREAFVLYALAISGRPEVARMSNLYENRDRLDINSKAFLALALHQAQPEDARLDTLISDIVGAANLSASGAFWENTDRLNWTTDTRATAVALEALITIRPESDLIPNAVRYLVSARTADHWETTQETAWSIMALTNWMVVSGELRPDFTFEVSVNGNTLLEEQATEENVRETRELAVDVMELVEDEANRLVFERTDGPGVMYYTTFLDAYLPVEQVEPLDNGISVARRYLNANGEPVTSARVGEIIEVRLTVVVPNSLHYVVIEDPIPAGTEAINPDLETSQQIGTRPELDRLDVDRFGWGWWWFSNIEYRDEMVALYSTYLPAGTYEYVYSIRAAVPGEYNVIPPTAEEFYFPDVYGRGAGSVFTVEPEA